MECDRLNSQLLEISSCYLAGWYLLLLVQMMAHFLPYLSYLFHCLLPFLLYIEFHSLLMASFSFCWYSSLFFALSGKPKIKALALSPVWYLALGITVHPISGEPFYGDGSSYTFVLFSESFSVGRVKNGTSHFSSGVDVRCFIAVTTLEHPCGIQALIQIWAVNLILSSCKCGQLVGGETWESGLRQLTPGRQGVWENLGIVLVRLGWS